MGEDIVLATNTVEDFQQICIYGIPEHLITLRSDSRREVVGNYYIRHIKHLLIISLILILSDIVNGQYDPKHQSQIDSMRHELLRNDLHDTTLLQLEFNLAERMWVMRLSFWG